MRNIHRSNGWLAIVRGIDVLHSWVDRKRIGISARTICADDCVCRAVNHRNAVAMHICDINTFMYSIDRNRLWVFAHWKSGNHLPFRGIHDANSLISIIHHVDIRCNGIDCNRAGNGSPTEIVCTAWVFSFRATRLALPVCAR